METNLLDLITEEEYDMLTNYRNWYAWGEDKTDNCKIFTIRDILSKAWNKEKLNLFHLLGNQLILEKEYIYEKSVDELCRDMEQVTENVSGFGREGRTGYRFVNNWYKWVRLTFARPNPVWDSELSIYKYSTEEDKQLAEKNATIRSGLNNLISNWTLAENKYDGCSFTIPLTNGKDYVVSNGCKPMRAIAKIAESYGIEDFEDFRICHSLIHNQKKVSGTISLSIHPLDYWTMSDNDCGWDSCMSWRDTGGYRQGTVEMMNSPMVVVAYLTAKEPMYMGNKGHKWNNKKWRQLFIVNSTCILGVKSYPYHNDKLTLYITKWLKELAETNLDWQYFGEPDGNPIKYNFEPFYNPDFPDDERKIKLGFSSNNMYTDVGCLDWHPLYVGKHIHQGVEGVGNGYFRNSYDDKPLWAIEINYSGAAQCMSCGDTDPSLDCESSLCCDNCQITYRCSDCGEYTGNEYYWVDDCRLCECCYERLTADSVVSYERHFKEDMLEIYLGIPTSEKYQKDIISKRGYSEPPEGFSIFSVLSEPIYIMSYEIEEFERKWLKGKKLKKCVSSRGKSFTYYLVNVAELNLNAEIEDVLPWQFYEALEQAKEKENYDELAEHFWFHTNILKLKGLEAK